MCNFVRILALIDEGRNQVEAVYFLPVSCSDIYHIWKSQTYVFEETFH